MPMPTTPGVYFETLDSDRTRVRGLRTDIAALVGIAERGPLDQPVRVSSQAQFTAAFGGYLPGAYLAYAAKAFFENGGRTGYFVRVAAPPRTTQTSALPQPADRSSSLVLDSTGFAAGAVVTVTQHRQTTTTGGVQPADRLSSLALDVAGFPPAALVRIQQPGVVAYRRVRSTDLLLNRINWTTPLPASLNLAAPIAFHTRLQHDHRLAAVAPGQLIWETPLETSFVLAPATLVTQPLTFATGAHAARAEFLDETRQPVLRCEASSPGSWGNALTVQLSRSHLQAARAAATPQPSTPDWLTVDQTAGFTAGTFVRLFQDDLGGSVHRTVTAVDPIRSRLRWNLPLPAAWYAGPVTLAAPLSLETLEFGLTVYEQGQPRESHPNLSLNPANTARFVETVVNTASALIRLHCLQPAPAAQDPGHWPDPNAETLERGRLTLAEGRDGTAALQAEDFTGRPDTTTLRGLRTLEEVDEVALVAIPDILIRPLPPLAFQVPPPVPFDPCLPCPPPPAPAAPPPPGPVEQPPIFGLDAIFAVQQAMVAHCELLKDRLAVLDPPWFEGPVVGLEAALIQSWRERFDSKYAALYYPWLSVVDPLQRPSQPVRAIPPSGHVLGLMARTDTETGVHAAPANIALRWVQGTTAPVSHALQGLLNPQGINCIRSLPGRGVLVYGARTVSRDPAWRYVNVRRLLMMIEEAVEQSVQWAVFEPHDLTLRATLVHAISSFLQVQWERGALVGDTADEAYFVRCDDSNNPPADVELGRLIADVGVAAVRPAEFIVFRLGRTRDELEIAE